MGRGCRRLRHSLSPLLRPGADLPQVLEQREDYRPAEEEHESLPSPFQHFDKPIPDQQDPQPRGTKSGSGGNFLYLRRTFHEALRSDTGDTGDWERLPLANTLQKLRLENTKVKGDGASVVLETCQNIY